MKERLILLALFLGGSMFANGRFVIDNTQNPYALDQNVMPGGGVQVFHVEFNGAANVPVTTLMAAGPGLTGRLDHCVGIDKMNAMGNRRYHADTGEERNDVFGPAGHLVHPHHMTSFDRWGDRIHGSTVLSMSLSAIAPQGVHARIAGERTPLRAGGTDRQRCIDQMIP